MPETERRRKRAAVSCVLCRRRKIRCNRELPCSNCLRARNGVCVYEPFPGTVAAAGGRRSASASPPLAESPPPTALPQHPAPSAPSLSLPSASSLPTTDPENNSSGVSTTLPSGPFFGEVIPSGGRVPCPRDLPPMFSQTAPPPVLPGLSSSPAAHTARGRPAAASPDGLSAARDGGDGDMASLRARVQQLETQLAQLTTGAAPASSSPSSVASAARTAASGSEQQSTTAPSSVGGDGGESNYGTNTRIQTATSSFGGTFHIHREDHWLGHGGSEGPTFSVSHKTRLFGQSHWVNSVVNLYMDTMLQMEPYVRDPSSRGYIFIQRCKHVSRLIKAQRCPQWPAPLTPDLPPKDLADKLVTCYLKTTERVYRILHVPSFMKAYERLWQAGVTPEPGFLVQVKLVLALGSVAYDDMFTMRTRATRWLYEAMTWLADPDFKRRLHLELLQSKIMVLIAREMIGIGGHMVWNSVGDVQRLAIMMGLHRDPIHLPRMSVLAREMRRRLWNTILELCLSTSLAAGGPPMFTVEDFDTAPPGNFNDADLVGDETAAAAPDDVFTDSTVAIALRRSMPVRLAITRFLNDLSGPLRTYQEAVRLDAEFRDCYRVVRRQLHGSGPSGFARRFVDMQLHRVLMALHTRFSGPEAQPALHAYSRKVVLEAALTLWRSANSQFALTPHALAAKVEGKRGGEGGKDDGGGGDADEPDYMDRIVAIGSGIMRTSMTQAACAVATELRLELREEEESMGLAPIRLDLLTVMQDAKRWSLRCIETGEKNVKGYIGMSLIDRQIRELIQKTPKDEIPPMLVKQLEEDEEVCLQMLVNHLDMLQASQPSSDGLPFGGLQSDFTGGVPGMVMEGGVGGGVDGGVEDGVNLADSQMADWQSMGLDVFSGTERLDQISWIFDDMASHEMPW